MPAGSHPQNMVRQPNHKKPDPFQFKPLTQPNQNRYAHPDAPKPIHPDKEHFCPSTLKLGAYIRSAAPPDLCRNRRKTENRTSSFPINDPTSTAHPRHATAHGPQSAARTTHHSDNTKWSKWSKWYGGDGRNRTDDPLLAKQVLYQLSYIPPLIPRTPTTKQHSRLIQIRTHPKNGGPGRTRTSDPTLIKRVL
jgi:hypothetical protein